VSNDPIQNVRVVSESRSGSTSATYEDRTPIEGGSPCGFCGGSGREADLDSRGQYTGTVPCSQCGGSDWAIAAALASGVVVDQDRLAQVEREVLAQVEREVLAPIIRTYDNLENVRRDFGEDSTNYLQARTLFPPDVSVAVPDAGVSVQGRRVTRRASPAGLTPDDVVVPASLARAVNLGDPIAVDGRLGIVSEVRHDLESSTISVMQSGSMYVTIRDDETTAVELAMLDEGGRLTRARDGADLEVTPEGEIRVVSPERTMSEVVGRIGAILDARPPGPRAGEWFASPDADTITAARVNGWFSDPDFEFPYDLTNAEQVQRLSMIAPSAMTLLEDIRQMRLAMAAETGNNPSPVLALSREAAMRIRAFGLAECDASERAFVERRIATEVTRGDLAWGESVVARIRPTIRHLEMQQRAAHLVSAFSLGAILPPNDNPNCRCVPLHVHDEILLAHSNECAAEAERRRAVSAVDNAWSNPEHERRATDWSPAAAELVRGLRAWAREHEPGNEDYVVRVGRSRNRLDYHAGSAIRPQVVSRANARSVPGRPNSRDRRRWRRKVREMISIARDLATEGRRGDVLAVVAEVVSPLDLAIRMTDLARLNDPWGRASLRQAAKAANFGTPLGVYRMNEETDARLRERLRAMELSRSVTQALIIDSEDWAPPAPVEDLTATMDAFADRLAAATQIPRAVLMGGPIQPKEIELARYSADIERPNVRQIPRRLSPSEVSARNAGYVGRARGVETVQGLYREFNTPSNQIRPISPSELVDLPAVRTERARFEQMIGRVQRRAWRSVARHDLPAGHAFGFLGEWASVRRARRLRTFR